MAGVFPDDTALLTGNEKMVQRIVDKFDNV